MTPKPEGPMTEKAKALLRKQEQGINMGEARIHLGRFAKSFAQVKQKAKNAEKAASVPPPPKQKTYDVEELWFVMLSSNCGSIYDHDRSQNEMPIVCGKEGVSSATVSSECSALCHIFIIAYRT